MTNHRTYLKAIPAAILVCASGFAAADTQNMAVSATVSSKCKFDTTVNPISMAFADIDPSSGGNAVATADIVYRCTNGTTPSSLAPTDGQLSRNMANGLNNLPYTLSFAGLAAGTGFSAGQAKTVVVTGTITPAQFNDALALTYTDTVGMTILP
jgi:hypothetical protein